MYESPIHLYMTDIQTQIIKKQEEQILKAVQSVAVGVDHDELFRALQYDRGQYDKGYKDGKADAAPRWIPVTERLPEKMGQCVCRYVFGENTEYPFFQVLWYFANIEKPHFQHEGSMGLTVTHWMPLPEPPKEGE